jgi:hypothetical protein
MHNTIRKQEVRESKMCEAFKNVDLKICAKLTNHPKFGDLRNKIADIIFLFSKEDNGPITRVAIEYNIRELLRKSGFGGVVRVICDEKNNPKSTRQHKLVVEIVEMDQKTRDLEDQSRH